MYSALADACINSIGDSIGQRNKYKQYCIEFREVVSVTIKNIVIVNGKEVEIKDLPDRESFANSVNERVLLERNYEVEKTA